MTTMLTTAAVRITHTDPANADDHHAVLRAIVIPGLDHPWTFRIHDVDDSVTDAHYTVRSNAIRAYRRWVIRTASEATDGGSASQSTWWSHTDIHGASIDGTPCGPECPLH